jgi:hypothetical protein
MAAPGGAIDAALANIVAAVTANPAMGAIAANHNTATANHNVVMGAIAANHAAATANHAANMGAIAAQTAAVAAIQAQLAAIQAQLAAIVNPAQISGNLLAISSARAANAHCRRGIPYAVVPLPSGALPPHWPLGFERSTLLDGLIGPVDNLLEDYGLPFGAAGGTMSARRQSLGLMIGTPGI